MVNPSGGDPGWVKIFFGKGASPATVIAVGNADPTSVIAIAESSSFVISGSSPVVVVPMDNARQVRECPIKRADACLDDEREAQDRFEHNVELVEAAEDTSVALESAEPAVLRNYSITPTRAPADVRDASRPAPITTRCFASNAGAPTCASSRSRRSSRSPTHRFRIRSLSV
jgi:phage-related tail fiber protein